MGETISFLTLKQLSLTFNYQYKTSRGEDFFNLTLVLLRSKKTDKIRYLLNNNELIATIRPTNGHILLSIPGAKRFLSIIPKPNNRVVILNSVEDEIKNGKDVYAKHVLSTDSNIRPSDEVIIVNEKDELLAVGRAILNGDEMLNFNYGLAIKTRKGIWRKNNEEENES